MSARRHKRLRYRVAYALNRLPSTCWTHLVSWVEFGAPLRESFDTSRCLDDGWCEGKQCYCGKLGTECLETLVDLASSSPQEET